MALFQPTNVYPSTFSGTGGGTIDATEPLAVSWQVNGNSPLLAYEIFIYENTPASLQLLTTGKITLDAPFFGVDYTGAIRYFEAAPISAADMATAGIVNGYAEGYKLKVTQWWGATNAQSITQSSASVFITRSTPTLILAAYPNPITTRSHMFSAVYSQAQGDALNWVSWKLLDADGNSLVETGDIIGTSDLRLSYDGFFPDSDYTVQCTVETQNGVRATTGEQTVHVRYSTISPTGELIAEQIPGRSCVALSWGAAATGPAATGRRLYRRAANDRHMEPVYNLPLSTTRIYDYAAKSQMPYTYYLTETGDDTYMTEPLQSEQITPIFWDWTVLECIEDANGVMHVHQEFAFGLNVVSGDVSNNNVPNLLKNFTPYPARQPATQNYASGTLKAYIGLVEGSRYVDSLALAERIMELSVSANPKFLKDRKGNLLRIETNAAVTMKALDENRLQPYTMVLPWVETGSARGVSIVATQ